MPGIPASSAAARLSAREASLHARRSAAAASYRLRDPASKARNWRAVLSSMVRAHLGSRGRTSPPPTMAGIRLAPTVDQTRSLDVAGGDGNPLRIAAHCVAEYVNGLYSPMGVPAAQPRPCSGAIP